MAVTRQQIRLAGCGAVAALSLAVLCLHRPSAWGQYVAWSIARIGLPLFVLFSGILAGGLLLLAFSRYRRKPELLAAALAISALLHLLLVASFTFWDVGVAERPRVGEEIRFELAVGLPSLTEDLVARQLQEALLEPLERETKSIDTEKPAAAELDMPVDAQPAPDPEAPERDPSALEPLKAAAAGERRLEIEDAPTEKAQAEADAEDKRILKMRSVKTAAEPEAEAHKDARAFEAARADAAPVALPAPGAHAPAPDLPAPERAARMEIREIKLDHAAPLHAEVKPRQAKVELETVKLDVAAAAEAMQPQAAEEAAGQKGDERLELTVAAPKRTAAKVQLPSVDTPAMSTQADAPAPRAIPQELPGVRTREAPADPLQAVDTLREMEADAVPLMNRVEQVNAPRSDEDGKPAAVPMPAEALTAARAQALTPSAQAQFRTEGPAFTAVATAAPETSMEEFHAVADVSRGAAKPRLMESAEAGAPRRAEERNAASVTVQVALLQEQAAPAGTAVDPSDSALRELAAGRADLDAFPERANAQRQLPGRAAMRSTSLTATASQTLVNEQARVQYREAPSAADEAAGGTAPRGVRSDTGTLDGLAIRQTQLAASAPGTDGTGVTARVTATVVPVARASGRPGAESAAPAAGHPAAPLVVARSTDGPSTGSMAGGTLPQGTAGRTVPSAPEAGGSPAAAPGDAGMMMEGLVAGRMQAAEVQGGGTPEGGESQGRGPAAGVLIVERAGRGTETGGDMVLGARPELALGGTAERSGGTLADTAPLATGIAGTTVRGPAELAAPGRTPMTADSGTVALPMKAWSVERAPAGDGDVAASVPRAVEIGTLAKAEWGERDETSASAAPLRGWKAPPLPAGRGSGVRLSLDPGTVAGGRRVEAGAAQGTGTAPETERSRIADDVAGTTAAAQKKAIYELRSPEKRRFIQELGGSPETEEAVEQALVWLAGAQSEDGRWDVDGFTGVETVGGAGDRIDGNVAVTGLSLLAYLGASYTHTAGKHRETVRKGLEWLIEGQTAEGDLRRGGTMYDQAMATAAICESLSLTGDKRLAEAARLAAGFIMKAQSPNAAWRYEPQVDSDTSALGWQILALKSAEISGVAIPQQHYAWSGMWLDQVRQGNGGLYAYKPGHGPTPVMTAEGWFCQLFMGEEVRRQGQQESINYILENLPVWSRGGRGTVHLYYWYYATLALRLSGAPEFETWNKALKAALLEGRRREGPAAGSWDPECQLGPRGGRIYATAMSTLCLEVYYRYLPFYRRMTAE